MPCSWMNLYDCLVSAGCTSPRWSSSPGRPGTSAGSLPCTKQQKVSGFLSNYCAFSCPQVIKMDKSFFFTGNPICFSEKTSFLWIRVNSIMAVFSSCLIFFNYMHVILNKCKLLPKSSPVLYIPTVRQSSEICIVLY